MKSLKVIGAFCFGAFVAVTIESALVVNAMKDCTVLNELESANYRTLEYKIELIRAFDSYYYSTEKYLDEINEYHHDISFGSDAEQEYYDARAAVDSLYTFEL